MLMTSSEQDQLVGVAQMILRMLHHGAFQQVLAEGGVLPAGVYSSNILLIYCKQGKIYWAKHLRFQPYKVFHGALVNSVYYLTIAKYSWENFHSTLKNRKSLT